MRRQFLKIFRRILERNAPVTRPMLVSALEILPGVSKQERPRRHQFAPGRRPILEGARCDDCDARISMLFFERAVLRAERANDIEDTPARSPRQYPPDGYMALATNGGTRGVRFGFDRNFRQELPPLKRYNSCRAELKACGGSDRNCHGKVQHGNESGATGYGLNETDRTLGARRPEDSGPGPGISAGEIRLQTGRRCAHFLGCSPARGVLEPVRCPVRARKESRRHVERTSEIRIRNQSADCGGAEANR